MKLVVGLGNPGAEYARTRHNIGFMVVDRFADRRRFGSVERRYRGHVREGRIGGESVVLLEPSTYMNLSGEAVADAIRHLGLVPDDLLVVHDDVDFDLGTLRIKRGGGPGGHKGIRSILEHLEQVDFTRLRAGVGRPDPGGDVSHWVLDAFAEAEQDLLDEAVDAGTEAIELWVRRGTTVAMNQFNRRQPIERSAPTAAV